MEKKRSLKQLLSDFTKKKIFILLIFEVALILLFAILCYTKEKNFLTISTLKNILTQLVVTSMLTIGAGCLLIGGNLDLSQAKIGCLGGVIIANMSVAGYPWYLCILAAIVVCACLGFVNGLLVTRFKFPAFIATLGMSYVVEGIIYIFSAAFNGGTALSVNYKNPQLQWLFKTNIKGFPVAIIFMIIMLVIYGILIKKTRFGLKMTLVGGNPRAARIAGIDSAKVTTILFINAAVLACIGGWLQGSRVGQGSLTALSTNQFTGLTAAIIGGISFGGGVGGMGGAFVGMLILNTFSLGMNVVGVNPYVVNTFSGVLLVLALSLDRFTPKKKLGK